MDAKIEQLTEAEQEWIQQQIALAQSFVLDMLGVSEGEHGMARRSRGSGHAGCNACASNLHWQAAQRSAAGWTIRRSNGTGSPQLEQSP